ncbi:MAG: hypothetical protein M9938_10555 [Solirubrobacterales bacterium]|nr:hypothetical protein [Solirubrobacterales bacterium]
MSRSSPLLCDWCAVRVSGDDGYRLLRPTRDMGAAFCRLEHVVPWLIKKNDWHIWSGMEAPLEAELHGDPEAFGPEEDTWYLVRHRDSHRIADGFESRDDLIKWATAGGRYA